MTPRWPACALLLPLGCGTGDVREWQPSDHRHTSVQAGAAEQVPEASPSASAAPPGLDEVTLAAWRRNCTSCHGPLGRGDGPQAAMSKPRDLTDPAWHASITDEGIGQTILQGRGRMPAFPLPESTVRGLVHLVRLLGRAHMPAPPASAAAVAPSGSAAEPVAAPSAR